MAKPPDRNRGTIDPRRAAAEAVFKKPAERAPERPSLPNARESVSLRIDTDVLAHHPTVVVIMFGVNDENRAAQGNTVPPAAYRKNLVAMIEKIRAAGGTPVLMTTSMKNLDWVGTAGNLAEYANVVRDLAKEQKLTLIDNFAAWEQLPKRGYNYMIYLDSCINHPGEAGHVLFFEGVKAAFDFE